MADTFLRTNVLERLEQALEERGFAERTRNAYRRWALALGDQALDDPRQAARCFLDELAQGAAVAPGTVRQARTALAFLLETLGDARPLAMPQIARAARMPVVPITEAQMARLRGVCRGSVRTAAELMYGCGLTARETAALRIGDVDIIGGALSLPGRKLQLDPQTLARVRWQMQQLAQRFPATAAQNRWKEQPLLPTPGTVPPPAGLLWRGLSEETLQRHIGRGFRRIGMPTNRACQTLQDAYVHRALQSGATADQIRKDMGWASATPLQRIRRRQRAAVAA